MPTATATRATDLLAEGVFNSNCTVYTSLKCQAPDACLTTSSDKVRDWGVLTAETVSMPDAPLPIADCACGCNHSGGRPCCGCSCGGGWPCPCCLATND